MASQLCIIYYAIFTSFSYVFYNSELKPNALWHFRLFCIVERVMVSIDVYVCGNSILTSVEAMFKVSMHLPCSIAGVLRAHVRLVRQWGEGITSSTRREQ